MPNDTRQPTRHTDAELLRMVRAERVKVIQQLSAAKAAVREQASTVEALESRLHNIEVSEDYLTDRSGRP